jgi:ribonuclease Z
MEADAQRAEDTFHSTAKQAAQMANLLGAKNLLLGHFSSRYVVLENMLMEAKIVFDKSELSEEGKTYPIFPAYE